VRHKSYEISLDSSNPITNSDISMISRLIAVWIANLAWQLCVSTSLLQFRRVDNDNDVDNDEDDT